jgi:hypothetical protein
VPVYRAKGRDGTQRYLLREAVEREQLWTEVEEVAFFAFPSNRGRGGVIPIFAGVENRHAILRDKSPGNGNQPLFFALPPLARPAEDILEGGWQLELKDSDGGTFEVSMELKVEGETVSGKGSDGVVIRAGNFKNGRLSLRVLHEEKTYDFTAALEAGKLAGEWKRSDGQMGGSWSGVRLDSTPPEERSPALVPLYEYRNSEARRFYSTNPGFADDHMKRGTEPLCRVWRNPMAALALDPAARPIPLARD